MAQFSGIEGDNMANQFKFRMRLYLLTCVASIAWFASTIHDALRDHTLQSVPTIFLLVCIAIVIVYTGYSGMSMWIKGDPSESDSSEDANTQDSSAHESNDGKSMPTRK